MYILTVSKVSLRCYYSNFYCTLQDWHESHWPPSLSLVWGTLWAAEIHCGGGRGLRNWIRTINYHAKIIIITMSLFFHNSWRTKGCLELRWPRRAILYHNFWSWILLLFNLVPLQTCIFSILHFCKHAVCQQCTLTNLYFWQPKPDQLRFSKKNVYRR